MGRESRAACLTLGVSEWFERHARELPWRVNPRDPYRSLVSEFMLQQTQVSRVIEKFEPFIRRFPTPRALARAREASVLAAWSGLGYYRRARMLHAAARAIARECEGEIPREAARLQALPGVGRYTAGAIASIVFGAREPIVDGNVARVLLRVEGRRFDHDLGLKWAWRRTGQLVSVAPDPARFNEGLMELGAVVCTPRSPACDRCPLAGLCRARRAGVVDRIPRPRPAPKRSTIHAAAAIVRDPRGRILLERRGTEGLWSGLWQAPTLETTAAVRSARSLALRLGLDPSIAWSPGEGFAHVTSHRRVVFRSWVGRAESSACAPGRRWVTPSRLGSFGLSSPQRRLILGVTPCRSRR